MIIQPIVDLVALCVQKGIKNVILSPGSRCAPLTLAFARHSDIHSRIIPDERAAAFIALGMAQQLEKPVALVCTSGSAALNYAPAIAEAFFQQIPLLILTADRPPEWIDQWDGQTIRQHEIYGKHVKGFYQFPDEFGHEDKVWHANRIGNEAINLAMQLPYGPVHVNIPLREPFYPEKDEYIHFDKVRGFEILTAPSQFSEEFKKRILAELDTYNKIIIVPGQQVPDVAIRDLLERLSENRKAVVVTDCISNQQNPTSINFHDHFIGNLDLSNDLQPDLIISFGKSIISKGLKLFLRRSTAAHWHVQEVGDTPDTYQNLQKVISCQAASFLGILMDRRDIDAAYLFKWNKLNQRISENLYTILDKAEFGEYKALSTCLEIIPEGSKIHVANSMAVRYLNFLGNAKNHEIYCNRGTSGIDGSNSTAVGCTFTTKDFVTLITGDMAFFYDRNAFWHNYPMPNLRIILLNNHAGGIFRLIDGPANQPELEEFFETKQVLTAKNLAEEFNFLYHSASDESSLEAGLQTFYKQAIHPKILEIRSDSKVNAEVLKKVKANLKIALK